MNLTPQQEAQLIRTKDQLKTKNIRLTQIRLEILKIIIGSDHPTITDIIATLEKSYSHVNIMSVYNTLDMLLENHILFANTFNGKQICYEIQTQGSCHLKCDNCLKIKHLDAEELGQFASAFKKISHQHAYTSDHFKIEIHGYCAECQNKINR